MFASVLARLDRLEAAPARIAEAAAPRIEARLRADATTKRGNIPGPITADAGANSISVTAPDWVIGKAIELDEVDGWVDIVTDEARAAMGGT